MSKLQPPPIEPAHMTHFVVITNLLGESLAEELQRCIRGEERAMIAKLATLSIPDAVRYVRQMLGVDVQECLP